ncbi:hypothetical protein SESBI_07050 [Sesbania bispinosa]|nr:hypothetical protein SESBI_07050 [Sesbania bispinosa]
MGDNNGNERRTLRDYSRPNPNAYGGTIVRPPIQVINFQNHPSYYKWLNKTSLVVEHQRILIFTWTHFCK